MPESEIWLANKQKDKEMILKGLIKKSSMKDLFTHPILLRSMLFLLAVYLIWNLCAGTMGFFMPYIYETVGKVSNATANALQCGLFSISALSTYFIFMSWGDKVNRRILYFVIASLFLLGWCIFILPAQLINIYTFMIFMVLVGVNNGFLSVMVK